MRNLLLSAAFLGLSGAAIAQTYSVEPGLWELVGDGLFAGAEMPLDGTECIPPENAQFDVNELLEESGDPTCRFDHANGRDFTVSCSGETPVSASGELIVERQRVTLNGAGTILMEGVGDLPVSVKAIATRIGDC